MAKSKIAVAFMIFAFAAVMTSCGGGSDKRIIIKKPEIKEIKLVSSVPTEEKYRLMAFLETDGQHVVDVKVETNFEKGVIEIRDKDLAVVHKIYPERGKGPGEFMNPDYFYIEGERIHMLDGGKNTVEIFNFDGSHYDTVVLDKTISIFKWVTSCLFDGTNYYIAPLIPDIVMKFGKDGKALNSIKSHLKDNTDGLMWQEHACRLARDTQGNIYVSYNERGYEIDKYDADLNLIWSADITDKTTKKPGMTMTVMGDAKQPVGTFTHSSFFWKEGKIFVFRGIGGEIKTAMREGRKIREVKPIDGIENPFIDVFDAENCNFLYRIQVPFLETDAWAEIAPIGDEFVLAVLGGETENENSNTICKAVMVKD